jgi:uncharacterized glyoxalase superfamily protein PhnB
MAQDAPAEVVPNLIVESIEPLRSFYLDQLGFEHMMGMVGKDGNLDFCIVTREGAKVMLGRPQGRVEGAAQRYPTARPLELYIQVRDVDAYHEQVRGNAPIKDALVTQWWGDRNFSVMDPYGYKIWFYQTVTDWQTLVSTGKVPPPGITMV